MFFELISENQLLSDGNPFLQDPLASSDKSDVFENSYFHNNNRKQMKKLNLGIQNLSLRITQNLGLLKQRVLSIQKGFFENSDNLSLDSLKNFSEFSDRMASLCKVRNKRNDQYFISKRVYDSIKIICEHLSLLNCRQKQNIVLSQEKDEGNIIKHKNQSQVLNKYQQKLKDFNSNIGKILAKIGSAQELIQSQQSMRYSTQMLTIIQQIFQELKKDVQTFQIEVKNITLNKLSDDLKNCNRKFETGHKFNQEVNEEKFKDKNCKQNNLGLIIEDWE